MSHLSLQCWHAGTIHPTDSRVGTTRCVTLQCALESSIVVTDVLKQMPSAHAACEAPLAAADLACAEGVRCPELTERQGAWQTRRQQHICGQAVLVKLCCRTALLL